MERARLSGVPILHPSRVLIPFVVAAAACGFEPAADEPLAPPAFYRTWWARTEACAGRTGDFDRVKWYVVRGHGFSCSSGECAGHWEPGHRIYLSEDYQENELVVRHEMLHELLGKSGHPDPPFGVGCPLTWATWQGDRSAAMLPPD